MTNNDTVIVPDPDCHLAHSVSSFCSGAERVVSQFYLDAGDPVNSLICGVYRAIARSVDQGARTPIHVATSPDVEGITGEYFSSERVVTPSKAARDGDLAELLIYSRALSDEEEFAVGVYLSEKYGLDTIYTPEKVGTLLLVR